MEKRYEGATEALKRFRDARQDAEFRVCSFLRLIEKDEEAQKILALFTEIWERMSQIEITLFRCHSKESLVKLPLGGDFNCSDNAKKFTEEEVRRVCKVKGRVIV